jgi:multicomponent Na+:H+ antiporter subunit D
MKALVTIFSGWGVYWLLIKRIKITITRVPENFEHLIGALSIVLVLIFSMMIL